MIILQTRYLLPIVFFTLLQLTACGEPNIKPIVKKADNLIQAGKIEDAIIFYQKSIQDHPKESVLYINQAALFRKEQKYPHAIRNYRVLLKLNPESVWPYIGLGRVYLSQQKYDKAKEILKEGLKELPKNGPILFYLGRVYYGMGDGNQALEYLEKALDAQYPKMHNIYYYRGLTFENLLQNQDRAKMDFESYIMSKDEEHKDEVQKKLEKMGTTQFTF